MFSKLCQIYVTYHNWTFFSYRDFSNFWHRNYFECFTPQYFGIAHRFEHAIVFEIWTLNFLYHVKSPLDLLRVGMECESIARKELSYLTAVSEHINPIPAFPALRTIRSLRAHTPNQPHFKFQSRCWRMERVKKSTKFKF